MHILHAVCERFSCDVKLCLHVNHLFSHALRDTRFHMQNVICSHALPTVSHAWHYWKTKFRNLFSLNLNISHAKSLSFTCTWGIVSCLHVKLCPEVSAPMQTGKIFACANLIFLICAYKMHACTCKKMTCACLPNYIDRQTY